MVVGKVPKRKRFALQSGMQFSVDQLRSPLWHNPPVGRRKARYLTARFLTAG